MKVIPRYLSYLLFIFICNSSIYGQQKIPDSLKEKSYKYLLYKFYDYEKTDTIKALYYADVFKNKALKQKDTVEIADSYYFKARIAKGNLKIQFYDSIIALTKDKLDKDYPALAYIMKGGVYNNKRQYKKALQYFLLADRYAKKTNNDNYIYWAKSKIASIKSKRLNNED